MLKKENWFFCGLCNAIAYKFDCCNNTSCNGSGCDKCHPELHKEVDTIIKEGAAPTKEQVPYRNEAQEFKDLFEEI